MSMSTRRMMHSMFGAVIKLKAQSLPRGAFLRLFIPVFPQLRSATEECRVWCKNRFLT